MALLTSLRQLARDVLHLAYPEVCAGCGSDVLDAGDVICSQCFAALPATDYFIYPDNPVQKRFIGRMPVAHAGSTFHFTTRSIVQNLIFAVKYRGHQEAGLLLGRLTGKALQQAPWHTEIDAIVPLPLNRHRLRQRGYNQAALIARGIASVIAKPVTEQVAIRKADTETQTHKDRISRWQNMQYAFTVMQQEQLENKHVLLVDDVVTTGATLEACGQVILSIPGTQLSIATVAYTI